MAIMKWISLQEPQYEFQRNEKFSITLISFDFAIITQEVVLQIQEHNFQQFGLNPAGIMFLVHTYSEHAHFNFGESQ